MAATTGNHPTPYTIYDGLAVYRLGSGEPILLMPAPHRFQIPGDGSASPLIDGLVELGHQVISFDPPESGHSTRPSRLSMLEMHQCADEALDACAVSGPVDAMGHSMSGLTMLAYAIERPAHVRRLLLVGTGSGGKAYMNAPGALWNRSHPRFWQMALLALLHIVWPRLAPERMLNNFIHRQSFYDQSRAEQEQVSLGDWIRPRRGRTDWHWIASRLDYSPRLREIEAPALILCGCHDPQYPIACSQQLAAGIQQAQLVTFERSGHFPFVEEREAFWAAVGEFLSCPAPARQPAT
jgi:proline iminopeptidase